MGTEWSQVMSRTFHLALPSEVYCLEKNPKKGPNLEGPIGVTDEEKGSEMFRGSVIYSFTDTVIYHMLSTHTMS